MTPEYYKETLAIHEERFEAKKKLLAKEFAFSNSPYKIGDIVEDHLGKIKIEDTKWAWGSFDALPYCVYIGVIINKDGKPSKKNEKRKVHQTNIEKQ